METKSIWEKLRGMTVIEAKRACPNYLEKQFPRQIHKWNSFSKDSQEYLRNRERDLMIAAGYVKQLNGAWIK